MPPAKYVQDIHGNITTVKNSVCSAGCIISGSNISNSVLFSATRVHTDCFLSEAVILPSCILHRGCRLSKVVIDRGCELPRNLVVGENPELDAKRFYRTEGGVTLITREMLAKLQKDEPELFVDFDNYKASR